MLNIILFFNKHFYWHLFDVILIVFFQIARYIVYYNDTGTKFLTHNIENTLPSHNKFDCLLSVSIQFNYHNNNYFLLYFHVEFLFRNKVLFIGAVFFYFIGNSCLWVFFLVFEFPSFSYCFFFNELAIAFRWN